MKCEECFFRKKCELKTEEAVWQVRNKNMGLLEKICKASIPRFVDERELRNNFKQYLDMFYDVGAVLYTLPMREYLPGNDAEEDQERFKRYEYLKKLTYERCLSQADTRVLTLGRVSCGLVGEYSSGKSSYLNKEVFGSDTLPTNVGKSTSIPTYIFQGKKDMLVYENMQGNILISEDSDSLKLLSHSAKPEGCPCAFPWNTVIKRIFSFSSKLVKSSNIVYVDLPGYSATEEDNVAMMEASRGCDKILYFKPVQSGGLIEKDIKYLKELDREEIMVVLSKADKKSPNDCRKTLEAVKRTLKEKDIEVKDVILYSICPEKFVADRSFCEEMEQYRSKLKRFVTDTSAAEHDLYFAEGMVGSYLKEYKNFAENIGAYMNKFDEMMDDFMGKKALDNAFWNEWDNINKSIASSSKSYIDTHLFSENTVRLNDYLQAHIQRIQSCYLKDTYDSPFNGEYQNEIHQGSMKYLFMTAAYMSATKRADDNYEAAHKEIARMHSYYDEIRNILNQITSMAHAVFDADRYLYCEIVNDANGVYNGMVKAYSNLVQYAKEYEERWY